MSSAVIALSAAQGTGKTALADELAIRLGGAHASVSEYLMSRLGEGGQTPTPALLRQLGESLAEDPSALVQECLAHCGWIRGTSLVFDSIRHTEVLDALRVEVDPQVVTHVGLEVPPGIRLSRLRARGREPVDQMHEAHSTERQVPALVAGSDLLLDGTAPVDQLASEVLAAVRR